MPVRDASLQTQHNNCGLFIFYIYIFFSLSAAGLTSSFLRGWRVEEMSVRCGSCVSSSLRLPPSPTARKQCNREREMLRTGGGGGGGGGAVLMLQPTPDRASCSSSSSSSCSSFFLLRDTFAPPAGPNPTPSFVDCNIYLS